VCFTDISPADVALQLHGDSTPARQQLQQQSDTSITQPETFQQETVHTSSPDITNSAAVQSLHDLDRLNLGSEKRSREVREETVLDNFRYLYWMPPGPFIHELNNKQC
jgi:hypothetical protein